MGSSDTLIISTARPCFAYLVQINGLRAGRVFRMNPRGLSVGRGGDCEIRLDHPSVSQLHAKIRAEDSDDAFILYDLATTNGTKVNDEIISRRALANDDVIGFGEERFVFKQLRPAAIK
jgi:pSer/pThr/pTyr-binding forkhead associated (FHA) protein